LARCPRSPWLVSTIVAVGLAAAAPAAHAQPANDDCANATLIACSQVVSGTTVGAAPDSPATCGTSSGTGGAVWYKFIGTGDTIELSTCLAGSDYDTKVRVYSGTCASLTCIAGNDDSSCSFSSLRSFVSFNSVLGVEYLILMHGYAANQGNYELSLVCLAPPAPDPNDLCANATPIGTGTVVGDTPGNDSDGSSSCGNSDSSPSVWYRYTATQTLTLRAQTCGSGYDTVVSIHTGCPGEAANELHCSDNGCGLQSTAEAPVVAGFDYWIRVAGANGAAGSYTLSLSLFDPTLQIGPDVVYTDCTGITNWTSSGAIGGIRAYSLGSNTCNIGDENLAWGGSNPGRPLLGMNAYRLRDGRLEQIGMSWMKRGTGAAAGNGCGLSCNGQGGSVLGAGCLDVYSAGFNGGQSILGPRSEVNAQTGENLGSTGTSTNALSKRLQIAESDLGAPGDLYFIEGVYVAADDVLAGNSLNNASYKRVNLSLPSYDLTVTGTMNTYIPAIQAWADHGLGAGIPDPAVEVITADIPGEGRFYVASKVTDLGGTWRYDYAIFNLNSHRSADTFSVPIPVGASVTAIGFHDVDYHSGEPLDPTDWSGVAGATSVTWASPADFATDPNTNALRFGTMYNYWFESDSAPGSVSATIGIFRPGTPDSIDVVVAGPSQPGAVTFRRGDCNDDGGFDISDAVLVLSSLFPGGGGATIPPCLDACDGNDDGLVDIADPVSILDWLFSSGPLPPSPHPGCGIDPTGDATDCATVSSCP